MEKHKHDDRDEERRDGVLDADDTGMLAGERSVQEEEIEQALRGNPPPPRP